MCKLGHSEVHFTVKQEKLCMSKYGLLLLLATYLIE